VSRRLALEAAAFVAAAVVVAFLPRFISSYHALEWANVGIYFTALLGLNVLTGYSGQISLGHGAFMAIGGYTSAILIAHHGMRDVWTIPVAGLVAGAVGLAFGLPALRLRGFYLALATFGVAVAFPALVQKFDHFTGGSVGLALTLHSNDWLYYLAWAIGGAALVLGRLVLATPVGRAFRALRDSEVAAVSSGISPALYKTLAFGISSFYAGTAGALFAIAAAYVTPQTFPITLSLFLVVGIAVGGLGSLAGSVVGAILIQFLPPLAPHLGHAPPQVLQGAVLVAVMLLLPGGAASLLRRGGIGGTSFADRSVMLVPRQGRRERP
jgi:branched-chain amino acid transport system permease protein